MRSRLVKASSLLAFAACSYDRSIVAPDALLASPVNLSYQLVPSGEPDRPEGLRLTWDPVNDNRLAGYVVYSRASVTDAWSRRAETSSASFDDRGLPHLQYQVTAQNLSGRESAPSASVTVDERNRLGAAATLTSLSLNRGVQLTWSPNARLAAPTLFDYYRVYSTSYDLDRGLCDAASWSLEGTTVSEDFLVTGLPNGVPRCFAVSTISRDGHESVWTRPRADTPRLDARNVIVYSRQTQPTQSGFAFFVPATGQFGSVLPSTRADADFVVDRAADGTLSLLPVRAGTRIASYGPVADLTGIDVAPASGFGLAGVRVFPGMGYVFETRLTDGLHYGAIRVTMVGSDYVIFDWSYQTDPGNPELRRVRPGGSGSP